MVTLLHKRLLKQSAIPIAAFETNISLFWRYDFLDLMLILIVFIFQKLPGIKKRGQHFPPNKLSTESLSKVCNQI